MSNEAAERLRRDIEASGEGAEEILADLDAALTTERREVVKRIEAAVKENDEGDGDYYCDGWIPRESIVAILDAEAAR
jgi:hypothetical protein